jgi:ABC-type uncharacterized transport system permease subunit
MQVLWLKIAVVFYGLATLTVLPVALYDRPRWARVAVPAAVTAVFFHFVSVVEMLNAAHHLLPVEVHETRSLFGLIFGVTFLLIYWRFRTVSIGVFLLPIAFLLSLLPAFGRGREELSAPAVQGGWIFLHVALLLAAYAALAVSLIASVLYLVEERRLKSKNKSSSGMRWLPPLETLDQIATKSLVLGFPCMTVGLMIGSFIAEARIGASFFLDPKVLLSFAMWGAYVAMIFIRQSAGLRGRRAVYLSSFVMVVVLAVWAANQFSQVHRFPTP